MERKLFVLVGAKRKSLERGGEIGIETSKNVSPRVGMGAHESKSTTSEKQSSFSELRQDDGRRPEGKGFGDKLLYDDLNFKLPPAGIVGVIGPNGAGKTTIFKMIMDELQPDGGTFSIGETVKIGYVDQNHKDINPDKTVYDVVSNGLEYVEVGNQKIISRAYLSKFNFNGSDQNKKVGILSGGERNRLHLAMTLKTEANVLLLDEPTNDIDVNTLRALEEGIQDFAGCAVVVSHDRWFLDRICTHILAFEGDSQVYWFEGSYSEYEENRKKRMGDAGPKRIKYRKLVK